MKWWLYLPLQISFSCGIVIIDTRVVLFDGCCNLWLGCCCCSPCFDFQEFLKIFASFLNYCSKENWNKSVTFFDLFQWYLSYNIDDYLIYDGAGKSLARRSSFGCKILDKYCLLILSPSIFAIPKKVTLSVQILMTLDNWSLRSLPKMFLLFLRFVRLFLTCP